MPDLGVDVTVQPVGLDDQGRMGLFQDPSIAAWYQWGPAPASEAGSTVIAAHVDSLEYDLLPFARLKDAVAGTQVFVTDAAGTRHPYAVQVVEVLDKADVDWAAAFDRAGAPPAHARDLRWRVRLRESPIPQQRRAHRNPDRMRMADRYADRSTAERGCHPRAAPHGSRGSPPTIAKG